MSKRIEIDPIGAVILVVVLVWGISSIIEVWRGTAHVDGCGCIVHDGRKS